MIEIADIHCHLNFDRFKDRDEVIRRAIISGVVEIIDSGYDFHSNEKSLSISESYKHVHSTFGFSPNRIGKADHRYVIDQIKENADKIVGIGEVGLDLKKCEVKIERQKEIFLEFIDLAEELGLPLIIHARKAEDKAFDLLKNRDVIAVFHCYTGSPSLAENITDSGFYISISTLVCISDDVRKVAEKIDLNRLMLETDSPFLSPFKGRNEPANVVYALREVAKLKETDESEVAAEIMRNVERVFNTNRLVV